MEKAAQLLIEPYPTYQRHAGNMLATHPRTLIVGYGFGDQHITTLIGKFDRIHSTKRKVAIIDFVSPKTEDDREWHDVWGGMRRMWGSDHRRHEMMCTIFQLSAEDDPLDEFSYRESWTSHDGRLRVHRCGLDRVATHHADDLVDFLYNP